MKDSDYVFATSNLVSIENKMLKKDDFYRILESNDFHRAIDLLYDMGYFDKHFNSREQIEKNLEEKKLSAFKLIKSYNLEDEDMFLIQNNIYNIKVCIKSNFDNVNAGNLLIKPAADWTFLLSEMIKNDDLSNVPEEYRGIVTDAMKLSATSKNGKKTEEFLDNALYKIGKDKSNIKFFNDWFSLLEKNPGVDRISSDKLMKFLKEKKHNIFSVDPIFGYWIGILTEIKNIRIILFGLFSGIDKEIIRERLCDTYV